MRFTRDCFLDGRHQIQEIASHCLIFSPEWCFVPLLTAFHYPTQLLLMICHCLSAILSSCFDCLWFFSLFFLPLFTHLLIDLHSLLTDALSNSKWPVTLIAICCFSIVDCSALSIGPPVPSACLILPCPIYACDIYRFRLFSTSAANLHLPSATKLDCWLNLLDDCLL